MRRRRRRPRNKEERKEVSDYNKSVIISAEPGLYFPRQKLSSRTCEGDMLCDVKKMYRYRRSRPDPLKTRTTIALVHVRLLCSQ